MGKVDAGLPPAPRRLTRVMFFGVKADEDVTMSITLKKGSNAGAQFALPEGIVVRHGATKGEVVFWGTVLHHLRAVLPASPAMREALAAILAEAEAVPSTAAAASSDPLLAALEASDG